MSVLPRELVSLVHHVQLNQTGWWDAAVERLVLATLWRAGASVRQDSLGEAIAADFGVRLPAGTAERTLQRLIGRDDVLVLDDRRLKLPEARMAEYEVMRVEGERRETHVKDRFRKALEEVGCTCDPERTWQLFQETWLQPTVAAEGARTYELVTGAPEDWVSVADLSVFTDALEEEQREAGREAVARFFDPSDTTLRAYLLTLMDAYFVVEAGGLSSETITAINTLTATHPRFVVFLDTNTIFSMLGLHGAVAKEASRGVFKVAEEVASRGIVVKLYVTPQTLEEATGVLEYELETLSRLRIAPNMAREILAHGQLTGVHLALVEAVQRAGRYIRAEDFLAPYVRDLKTVLRDQHVELFNDVLGALVERENVAADIDAQFRFEKDKFGSKAKPTGALRHDIVLWHFVHGKRPARVDSPSDAHYWVLTEDRRFASFDAHKRRHRGVPICLHPLAFAQLLEFWNGRTEDTAAALVGGLRLALLTPHLGVESERTTLAIIAALSRWEGVEDLPESTIAHLLVNDALRQKIVGAPDPDVEFALVRDELMAEHQRVLEDRARATSRATELEIQVVAGQRERQEVEQRVSEAAAKATGLQRDLDEAMKRNAELGSRLDTMHEAARDGEQRERALGTRIDDLSKRLEARERTDAASREAAQRNTARRRFALRWVAGPLMAILALGLLLFRLPALDHTFWGDPRVDIGVLTLVGAVWAWAAHRHAETREVTTAWWLTSVLAGARWVLGAGAVAGLGMGIIGNALYDRSGLRPTADVPPLGTMSRNGTIPSDSIRPPTGTTAPAMAPVPSARHDTGLVRAPASGGPIRAKNGSATSG